MHLDVPFLRPGAEKFAVEFFEYAQALKRQGLLGAIGIIYGGTPADASDESWVEDAKGHIRALEDRDGLMPDQAVIQSWMAYPRHALPDSAPGSLTGLVNFYARRAR
jgi:hypothetical protein